MSPSVNIIMRIMTKMKLRMFVLNCLFFLQQGLFVTSSAEVTVSVDITQTAAHPGDNVTITCRVTGVAADRASDVIRWVKYVDFTPGGKGAVTPGGAGGTGSGREQEVIATGETLTPLYERLHRYQIVAYELDDVILHILDIHVVTVEDSGRIACVVPNSDVAKSSVTFHVFQKFSHISISPVDSSAAGLAADGAGTVILTDDPSSRTPAIRCRVLGVLPPPHFSFRVGQRLLGHHHTTNTTVNPRCASPAAAGGQKTLGVGKAFPVGGGQQSTGDKDCLLHLDYDVDAILSGYHVTYRDDGQMMTCLANQTHSGWQPGIATLRLNVQYAPKFNCSRRIQVEVGSINFVVECRLSYNPRPSVIFVKWRPRDDDLDIRVDPGDVIDGYSFQQELVDDGSRHSTVRLTIDRVELKQLTTYHFEARNDVSVNTHTVQLIQLHKPHTTKPVMTPSSRIHNRASASAVHRASMTSSSTSLSLSNISILVAQLFIIFLL